VDRAPAVISRHWTCVADSGSAEAYERHLRTEVLPAVRRIDGFRSARVLRGPDDDGVAYRVVTEWESMDAVRAFAGADYEVVE